MKKHYYLRAICVLAGLLLVIFYFVNHYEQNHTADREVWETVPLINQQARDSGCSGGEGGQWPHALAVSKSDSSLLFYGTNTGGIYRSENGGDHWSLSSRGVLARGSNAFAIDPCNDQFVLAAGISDGPGIGQGIYLSSDRGSTWEVVLELPVSGNKVYIDGLEYDESSFDKNENRCKRAYYSAVYDLGTDIFMTEDQKGLYRSEDGGRCWELVNSELTDAQIMVSPYDGAIYAARYDGLYVSTNCGEDFEAVYSADISGFDISWENNCVYLCTDEGLLEADIVELDFRFIFSSTLPSEGRLSGVAVSPVDPKRLLVQIIEKDDQFRTIYNIYCSENSGKSWKLWEYDKSKDFFPYLSFPKVFAWSYEDENRVWSFGGEHVTASRDGGYSWSWNSDGICGVLCGGKFHFNIFHPEILFFGAQDFNGALTTDGGKTWEYMDVSGNGGWGHVYGGYAASKNVFWGGLADSWSGACEVVISFDGGESFVKTGNHVSPKISNAELSSYQSYNNPQVYFCGNYRSSDGGKSWAEMESCIQVYIHNPSGGHELYGCEEGKGYVLVSYDEGTTWRRVNQEEIPLTNRNCLSEVQIDGERNVLYVAANGFELYKIDIHTGKTENITETLPKDEIGNTRVSGICIDAKRDLLYVAGYASDYNRKNSLLCSEDGGKTWKNAALTGEGNGQIVESAMSLALNSVTGELWASTACHGFVKLVKK